MKHVIVFDTKLTQAKERAIRRAVAKAAGPYYTITCTHQHTPGGPSFVGLQVNRRYANVVSADFPNALVARLWKVALAAKGSNAG